MPPPSAPVNPNISISNSTSSVNTGTASASNAAAARPPTSQQQQPNWLAMADRDPSRPPPPNYVCYRCGMRNHWIQFCPTLGNSAFDNISVKKTTGIPRSFLQTVSTGQ